MRILHATTALGNATGAVIQVKLCRNLAHKRNNLHAADRLWCRHKSLLLHEESGEHVIAGCGELHASLLSTRFFPRAPS